jgi:hypothetical protein
MQTRGNLDITWLEASQDKTQVSLVDAGRVAVRRLRVSGAKKVLQEMVTLVQSIEVKDSPVSKGRSGETIDLG